MPATSSRPLVYTETEVRSQLPTGWSLLAGAGRWNADRACWSVELSDGADNSWTVDVPVSEAATRGRSEALAAKIRQLERKALGRKSVITG